MLIVIISDIIRTVLNSSGNPLISVVSFELQLSYAKQRPYDTFRVHFILKMDRQTDRQSYCYKQFALLSLESISSIATLHLHHNIPTLDVINYS